MPARGGGQGRGRCLLPIRWELHRLRLLGERDWDGRIPPHPWAPPSPGDPYPWGSSWIGMLWRGWHSPIIPPWGARALSASPTLPPQAGNVSCLSPECPPGPCPSLSPSDCCSCAPGDPRTPGLGWGSGKSRAWLSSPAASPFPRKVQFPGTHVRARSPVQPGWGRVHHLCLPGGSWLSPGMRIPRDADPQG